MQVKPIISLYQHQLEYLDLTDRFKALVAGYGAGKTYANIQRTLLLLEYRKGDMYLFYAAPTYDLINSTYYPELIETLEMYKIKYKPNKAEHTISINNKHLKGLVKLVSLEHYEKLVSFNASDGIMDEFDIINYERQQRIWKKAIARLRRVPNATLCITTTPEGYKYTYELIKNGKLNLIKASTKDNKSLPDSYIDDLLSNYDDAHQAMYIDGEFANLNGKKAMYNFNRSTVIPAIDKIPSHVITLTVGMDFNVDPFCFTVSYEQDGKKITFDCFKIANKGGTGGYATYTDKAMCMLLEKYPNQYAVQHMGIVSDRIFNIIVRPDMTGDSRKTSSGYTDINIIKKYGVIVQGGTTNPPVHSRLTVANIALNKGLWLITDNCKELMHDLDFATTDKYGELEKKDYDPHLLDASTYDIYITYKDALYTKRKAVII
jgi:hypothetical protein